VLSQNVSGFLSQQNHGCNADWPCGVKLFFVEHLAFLCYCLIDRIEHHSVSDNGAGGMHSPILAVSELRADRSTQRCDARSNGQIRDVPTRSHFRAQLYSRLYMYT
jgi:hypothetical protein